MRVFVTGVTGFVGSCRSGSHSFRILFKAGQGGNIGAGSLPAFGIFSKVIVTFSG